MLVALASQDVVDINNQYPVRSPDGHVIPVLFNHNNYLIVRGQLKTYAKDPAATALNFAFSGMWTGPHLTISFSPQGELLLINMLSGSIDRRTGILRIAPPDAVNPPTPDAVSGPWLFWRSYHSPNGEIHLTNIQTGETKNLGAAPESGTVFPLSSGRFILHGTLNYLISVPS